MLSWNGMIRCCYCVEEVWHDLVLCNGNPTVTGGYSYTWEQSMVSPTAGKQMGQVFQWTWAVSELLAQSAAGINSPAM